MLVTILYAGNGRWSWLVKVNSSHCAGVADSHAQAWAQVNEFVGEERPKEPMFHYVSSAR